MPNTIPALLITLYPIALHGRESHYKNAEEKNNTRLESLKVMEAMFCDSIKRTLQRNKLGEEYVWKKRRWSWRERGQKWLAAQAWQSSNTGGVITAMKHNRKQEEGRDERRRGKTWPFFTNVAKNNPNTTRRSIGSAEGIKHTVKSLDSFQKAFRRTFVSAS